MVAFKQVLRCAVLGSVLWSMPAFGLTQSPAAVVRAGVEEVLAILENASLDAKTRRAMLTQSIVSRFDMHAMSQSILALRWKDATVAERERFVTLFTKLLEHIYISAIEGYTTEAVTVGGESVRGTRASVIVTIQRPTGADILLLFKLERRGEGWLAYDANIEGLSLVRHYREELDQVARQEGMTGVLEHLEGLVESNRS